MKSKPTLLLLAGLLFNQPAFSESAASKIEALGSLKNISVSEIKARQSHGLLKVQAKIVNTDYTDQQVYYRFKWFDSDGFEVADPDVWKPIKLIGKQNTALQSLAPSPKAKDFKIELQTPDN
jgi:uncharacterized protein YcfL